MREQGFVTRRRLAAAVPFATLAISTASLAASPADSPDAKLLMLGADFEEAWAYQVTMDIDLYEAAYHVTKRLVEQIEEVAAFTLDGILVKARACSWCHGGEPVDPDFFEGGTTDLRLAASILCDLLVMCRRPILEELDRGPGLS